MLFSSPETASQNRIWGRATETNEPKGGRAEPKGSAHVFCDGNSADKCEKPQQATLMEIWPDKLLSLPQALECLLRFPGQGVDWIFRGQEDISWKLMPSIGRPPFFSSAKPANPAELSSRSNPPPDLGRFNRWKRLSAGFTDKKPDDDFETLGFAQHYGLPTRLLDFSESALAALYFACAGRYDIDGAIYAYWPYWHVDLDKKTGYTVYDFPKHACLRLPPFDKRLLTQKACFVYFPDPSAELKAVKITSLDPNHKESRFPVKMNLVQFIIPADGKLNIARALEAIGVTRSSYFPDLEGLSRDLRDEVILRAAWKEKFGGKK